MRRSASEIINDLEMRVARLEKSAVNLRMNPAKKSSGIEEVVDALKDGSLNLYELSDFAVNTLRDNYRSLKEVRLRKEYEQKLSEINPSADLRKLHDWYARQMRGDVAGEASFKKFMKLKPDVDLGIPLHSSIKYYLYQALIANQTLRLP